MCVFSNPSAVNNYHSGPDSDPLWARFCLGSVRAPKRAAHTSGTSGTFWGTFVDGFWSGSGPKKGPNPARKDNDFQQKDY
jgi:hypothetical protein